MGHAGPSGGRRPRDPPLGGSPFDRGGDGLEGGRGRSRASPPPPDQQRAAPRGAVQPGEDPHREGRACPGAGDGGVRAPRSGPGGSRPRPRGPGSDAAAARAPRAPGARDVRPRRPAGRTQRILQGDLLPRRPPRRCHRGHLSSSIGGARPGSRPRRLQAPARAGSEPGHAQGAGPSHCPGRAGAGPGEGCRRIEERARGHEHARPRSLRAGPGRARGSDGWAPRHRTPGRAAASAADAEPRREEQSRHRRRAGRGPDRDRPRPRRAGGRGQGGGARRPARRRDPSRMHSARTRATGPLSRNASIACSRRPAPTPR